MMGKRELDQRAFGIRSVAEAFGLSHDSIKRLVLAGRIKSIHIGGRRLIPISEVDRLERDGLPQRSKKVEQQPAKG